MYRKAYSYLDFNSSIIPNFMSDTASDQYGTWTILADTALTTDAYKMFNSDSNDYSQVRDKTLTNSVDILEPLELVLPNRMSIKPKQFSIICTSNTAAHTKIYGYNVSTSQYEALGTVQTSSTVASTKYINVTTDNYYSKFKLVLDHMTSGFSSGAVLKYYDIRLLSGTIRKG